MGLNVIHQEMSSPKIAAIDAAGDQAPRSGAVADGLRHEIEPFDQERDGALAGERASRVEAVATGVDTSAARSETEKLRGSRRAARSQLTRCQFPSASRQAVP
jgi:hypothetical protein